MEIQACDEALLLTTGARERTDYAKCIMCQKKNKDKLRRATTGSITTFIKAMKQRQDSVFIRLMPEIKEETLDTRKCKWHRSCYQTYTSGHNIKGTPKLDNIQNQQYSDTSKHPTAITSPKLLRKTAPPIKWNVCLFCQKETHKKSRDLVKVSTSKGSDKIKAAAEYTNDRVLLVKIEYVDLRAKDAKYHKQCHAKYIRLPKSHEATKMKIKKEETAQ